MNEFYKKLSMDKIKIKFNNKPIKMELFLSFLTVPVKRSNNHLGSENGWTEIYGDDSLIIRGGAVRGVEILDSIKFKDKLDNPYNNYVNPFYLFDIFTDEGKKFFVDYYREEILDFLHSRLGEEKRAIENKMSAFKFWKETHGVTI